jgi:outer membrane protein OmpA-like peptidoglycan-associated protein
MAFNLDKNDSTGSSKKFDLSKSSAPTSTGTEQEKSKPKTWLFMLPLLLIAGIAAWYFLSKPGVQSESTVTATTDTGSTVASTAPTNQNSIAATNETAGTTTANPAAVQNNVAVPSTNINNSTPATFTKGSHAISNVNPSLVKNIIAFLQKNPTSVIQVNGYASSEGELAVNQIISQSRADAFKSYLVSKGIAAGRINASGKGISDPVSSNDTEEGRIKNRRVQIVFQ